MSRAKVATLTLEPLVWGERVSIDVHADLGELPAAASVRLAVLRAELTAAVAGLHRAAVEAERA